MGAERAELDEKAARVERMLVDAGLAGVIVGAQHNFAWITAGGTNRIDGSREAGAGVLLLGRGGRRYVLANVIEMPRIMDEPVAGQGYEPADFGGEDERSSPSFLVDPARKLLGRPDPIVSDRPAPPAVAAARTPPPGSWGGCSRPPVRAPPAGSSTTRRGAPARRRASPARSASTTRGVPAAIAPGTGSPIRRATTSSTLPRPSPGTPRSP